MPWQKQFDVDQAADSAMEAFWARGYAGTSMPVLLEAMGINRGSLYDTFSSKRELYLESIRRYIARFQTRVVGPALAEGSPAESVAGLFRRLAAEATEPGGERGCMLVNAITEHGNQDAEIVGLAQQAFGQLEALFRELIERAQARGEAPADRDPTEVARALMGLMIGVRVIAKTRPKPEVIDSLVHQAERLLRTP